MTIEESIMWFAGTGIGGMLLGKWISRKKDKFEAYLAEQSFYQKLISDLKTEREADTQEISSLRQEVVDLKNKITQLIDIDQQKDKLIESQRVNLLKWENYCEKLKKGHELKDKQIAELFTQLEKHENGHE